MTTMATTTPAAAGPATSDEDFSTEWLTHHPAGRAVSSSSSSSSSNRSNHVGDVIPRFVWNAQGLVLEEGQIVAYSLPQGRRPALYQWQSSTAATIASTASATATAMECQILTRQQVEESSSSTRPNNNNNNNAMDPPSRYSSHITNTIRERLEQNLHTYIVDHILPDCLLHALLEEAWAQFFEKGLALQQQQLQHQPTGSTTSSLSGGMGSTRPPYYTSVSASTTSTTTTTGSMTTPEYFTLQTLLQRIKAGATLAYNYYICHHPYGSLSSSSSSSSEQQESLLRRSRRTTLPPRPNPYQKGGKIALYLLDKLEGQGESSKIITKQELEHESTTDKPTTAAATLPPPPPPQDIINDTESDRVISLDEAPTNTQDDMKIQPVVAPGNETDPTKTINESEIPETLEMTIGENKDGEAISGPPQPPEEEATIDNGDKEISTSSEPIVDTTISDSTSTKVEATGTKETQSTTTTTTTNVEGNVMGDNNKSKTNEASTVGTSTRKRKQRDDDDDDENDNGKVVLINAHEEELESVEDDADQDEDFDTNDEMEAEDDDDDILEGVVKEQPQLDIDMDGCANHGDDDDDDNLDEEQEEEEDDDEDGDYITQNPLLQPTPESILEWMGRRGKSMGAAEIQEAVGICLKANLGLYDLTALDQRALGVQGDSFVLDSAGEKWKDLKKYEPTTFLRCKFRLKSDTEEEQEWLRRQELEDKQRKEKVWASWRFKGIHGGYSIWPMWMESVKDRIQAKKDEAPAEIALVQNDDQAQDDEALAQSLAAENASSRRSARRGNTKDGVFYGTQSQMSQKQLGETIVRICKQSFMHTLIGLQALVGDESSNPIHRLRTALARVLWKRNQIARFQVTNIWSDQPLWNSLRTAPQWTVDDDDETRDSTTTECMRVLVEYVRELHQTELLLRNMVLRQLTFTSTAAIATAADEGAGTLESFDSTDFEDPGSIEWKSTGHAFIGKRIFRPINQPAGGNEDCRWFEVKEFVESVPYDGPVDEKNENGAVLAERRMRFRAFAVDGQNDPLILTEAQVAAGIKAGEQCISLQSKPGQKRHPFAGGIGTKISLRGVSSSHECLVVGFDTEFLSTDHEVPSDNRQLFKVLLLPLSVEQVDAFWVNLSFDESGKISCCRVGDPEAITYKLEQSDFDEKSQAFQVCRGIISFLENHKHANIFLEPVDPIALNIPTYFDIVKRPMDISTLSKNLEQGLYSKISPTKGVGRSTISRMLNGPFRDDALLIFDNAIAFNPPDDWIHQTAKAIRKALVKKIEQATRNAEDIGSAKATQKGSVYVDEDSDVDMYEYESDRDDEDFTSGRRAKKRKRKSGVNKDDVSLKAIEGPIRLQQTLSETLGLRGPFARLPIISDANGFSLKSGWGCRHRTGKVDAKERAQDEQMEKELEEILLLQQLADESERATVRRSARAHVSEGIRPKGDSGKPLNAKVVYHPLKELPVIEGMLDAPELSATNRAEVEMFLEQSHETYYAKLYQQFSKQLSSDSGYGLFANTSFPPYLGRVLPASFDRDDATWEIRFEYIIPAVRWVIRGLIQSGHLTELEPLTIDAPFTSGVIMTSDLYYHDPSDHPFDLLEIRRKKKGDDASSEDEIELSEYEKLRAERVSRNAERLKMLGLA